MAAVCICFYIKPKTPSLSMFSYYCLLKTAIKKSPLFAYITPKMNKKTKHFRKPNNCVNVVGVYLLNNGKNTHFFNVPTFIIG